MLRILFVFLLVSGGVFAQHHHHGMSSPLTKSGNDIFDAIQEVVEKLEADPNTDWSKVDLEGLRQHLIDMKAFTEEVDVLSKEDIENGVKIIIKSQTERAENALTNFSKMHPRMLKMEKDWDMQMESDSETWTIVCTTSKPEEVVKLRALGYIGLVVEGAHHQLHHWMMATGKMKH